MNGTETFANAVPYSYTSPMTATLLGYARCSTDRQDLAAQRQALLELGVAEDRIYTDTDSPARTAPAPASTRSSLPCARATLWSCPNSTASPGPFRMPAPKENCAASSPNCPTVNSGNSAACTSPASIPSAISPRSSPSQDQPSIAHSNDAIPLSVRFCTLPESTRGRDA